MRTPEIINLITRKLESQKSIVIVWIIAQWVD